MTIDNAIKILEVAKAECEWTAPLEYQVAFDMATEALKKQDSKYYELGKKIMEDVQNALLYGTKGKGGDGE